ncbi:hypothetical protein I302_103065 [Kwoniella bestiolae CBS 10118]|uniref:Arf-GAP domain-containing protein n=1 Tax=Kwoniella bestiolae CBS 10118 TaxID=1296100 RepID=A0A1B9GGP9_9TREE|nr:hypothetical protein I302_01763 [Kwoniella bestiolae CBS 10118]OCF30244.1 hypothetical protein I302_01763 [Kwoniella bestiolae CBS 10118]
MREVGNTSSNAIFNPNEILNPPPPSYGHDERDSEIERYIRKKYEMGAFKVGTKPSASGGYEPISLNRARERDGRIPFGSVTESHSNSRNPELNDIISFTQKNNPLMVGNWKERDLPALPPSTSSSNPPRSRPQPSQRENVPAPWATPSTNAGTPPPSQPVQPQRQQVKEFDLIDFNGAQSQNATLPLQVNMSSQNQQGNGYLGVNQQHSQQQGSFGNAPNGFSSSPVQGYSNNGFVPSQSFNGGYNHMNGNGFQQMNGYNTANQSQSLTPQSQFNGFMASPLTPSSTPSPNMAFSSSPSFAQQPQIQFGQQQQQAYNPFPHQTSFVQPQQQSFMPQQPQQQYQMGQQQQYGGMPVVNGYMQHNGGQMMMQGMGMGH